MTEIINTLLIVFISIFFLLGIFLAIKFYYEINVFLRMRKVINNLIYWKSFFFLRKFIELKNLSEKTLKYQNKFVSLFEEYESLISKKTLHWITEYVQILQTKKSTSFKLIESEKLNKHYDQFEELNANNTLFANRLKTALKLEQYCLNQVYKLQIIYDLMLDEINKTSLKVDFNFKKLINFWNQLPKNLTDFEGQIYVMNQKDMQENIKRILVNYEQHIVRVIDYLKIILLFHNAIPSLKKTILQLIEKKLSGKTLKKTILWFNNFYKEKYDHLNIEIQNYHNTKIIDDIFQFYLELETRKKQLEKLTHLRKFLDNIHHYFFEIKEQITSWEKQLKNDIRNLHHETYFFFYNLQHIEELKKKYQNWSIHFNNWNKKFLEEKEFIFLDDQIIMMQKILQLTLEYLQKYQNIRKIFNIEQQRIETFILTIININTFIFNPQFKLFRTVFDDDLQKIINKFIALEKKILEPVDNQKIILMTSEFNDLEFLAKALKDKIEKKFVNLKIAEQLFVINNRVRFQNTKITNQMLNAEMLFLRGFYNKSIEQLVDVYEKTT